MEIVLVVLVVLSAAIVGFLAFAQSGDPPAPGKAAPDFRLPDLEGREHTPASFAGRRAVYFFHPQDETPECIEALERLKACAAEVEATGAALSTVVVSTRDAADAYARSQGLAFRVLCDPSGRVAKSYGALVNLGFMKFARKLTVVVDSRGVVERAWRDMPGIQQVDEMRKLLLPPAR